MRFLKRFLGGSKTSSPPNPTQARREIIVAPTTADVVRLLEDAAQTGGLEKVKALLKDNPDFILTKDEHHRTPLHEAAAGYSLSFKYHKDIVELLLTNSADVNAKDNNGNTPLDFAVMAGRKDVAELLRQLGGELGNKSVIRPLNFTSEEEMQMKADAESGNVEMTAKALLAIYNKCFLVSWALADGCTCVCQGICRLKDDAFVCSGCGRTSRRIDYDEEKRHKLVAEIGYKLNFKGGLGLMQSVGGRFVALGGKESHLSMAWDKIGSWRD